LCAHKYSCKLLVLIKQKQSIVSGFPQGAVRFNCAPNPSRVSSSLLSRAPRLPRHPAATLALTLRTLTTRTRSLREISGRIRNPISKSLRPVVGVVLIVCGRLDEHVSEGRHRPPYIARRTRVSEVGGPRVLVGYNRESYLYGLQ
jgi:hypothetical protein